MYISDENAKKGRRTQAERREGTRLALVRAAGELFAEKGFAGVTIGEVVMRAGMTKGALYHHFADKKELFRAVVEDVEAEVDGLVVGAAGRAYRAGNDPLETFLAATRAYLDACLRPEVRRTLLLDGPAVLGWREWHEVDAAHAVAQIQEGLDALAAGGLMSARPSGAMAHMIHGALTEAAMYVAGAEDSGRARGEAEAGIRHLMEGLCDRRGRSTVGENEGDTVG